MLSIESIGLGLVFNKISPGPLMYRHVCLLCAIGRSNVFDWLILFLKALKLSYSSHCYPSTFIMFCFQVVFVLSQNSFKGCKDSWRLMWKDPPSHGGKFGCQKGQAPILLTLALDQEQSLGKSLIFRQDCFGFETVTSLFFKLSIDCNKQRDALQA